MMDQQIVGMRSVDELAVVARERLETPVCGLDENLRFVAGPAEHPLSAEHLVADCVSVAEGRQHLVSANHADPADPVGSAATTCSAGGRFTVRRPNQRGTASMARVAGSFFSRSHISRYFR